MSFRLSNSRRKGFGLLEVTFSTAIFIVVVGSLVTLSRLSLRNAVLSTQRSQAMNLAQDGIESVRQMRDTSWIRDFSILSTNAPPSSSDKWLTWPIVTDPATCSGQLSSGTLKYARPVVYLGSGGKEYGLCYNEAEKNNKSADVGFSLFEISPIVNQSANDPSVITLVAGNGEIDPGQPVYRRTVRFTTVPATDGTASQPIDGCTPGVTASGLQFFAPNQSKLCTLTSHETYLNQPLYVIKVSSVVTWKAFDKDWQAAVETILTDWRSQ